MTTTKKKPTKKAVTKKTSRKLPRKYVTVSNRNYGKALKGILITWEGARPRALKDDGRINLGKNILEVLKGRFARFRWIITEDITSITMERGIAKVRTSQQLLSKMGSEQMERSRDIKNDIIRKFFAIHFTNYFEEAATPVYVPGSISKVIHTDIIPRLSTQDKEALNAFLPDYISSESLGTVNMLKAAAQIETLKGLATDLANEIPREHPESWWQTYVK